MPDYVKLLQETPIFGAVQHEALQFIVDAAVRRNLEKGEFLFAEGELASSMFVLVKGKLAVSRKWQGNSFKLRELGKGDCVGEMALLACSVRSASVYTLQPSTLLEISNHLLADVYQQFAESYTIIVMNMGREVCRRLEKADRRLFVQERSQQSISDMLA